jgi:hypothetical protein
MSVYKRCQFCGETIDANAAVCNHCKSILSQPAAPGSRPVPPPPATPPRTSAPPPPPMQPPRTVAPPPQTPPSAAPMHYQPPQSARKGSGGLIAIVLALVLLLGGGGAAVYFLFFGVVGCNGNVIDDPQQNGEDHQGGQQEIVTEWVSVAQEGISFEFDASLAGTVDLTLIPASEEDFMYSHPTYLQFILNHPNDAADSFSRGYLTVFSVERYRQIDSMAGDIVNTLAEMLATGSTETTDFELPYLPFVNAGQLFHSNVHLVSFKNGEGIRYLTMHVQDLAPILNEGLLYTFQGLTNDKQYYISFSIPVSHPALTDTWDEYFADLDYLEFSDNFRAYLEQDREILDGSPDTTFSPPLTILDQLVESIMVDNPAILLEEPDSVG